MTKDEIIQRLLGNLKPDQERAVRSDARRVLVVAGAGSGKTEVMARRIAWWIGVEGVPKEQIVAFTFTEKAAEEIKFRVRRWVGEITPAGQDVNLGGMFVGTIHGFCIAKIREYWPDDYHNYDILDEAARAALILRGFNGVLALNSLKVALGQTTSQSATIDQFITGYDQLHEHNKFDIRLADGAPPYQLGEEERVWCRGAQLLTDVGDDQAANAFATSAARYYAYLRCRRFLDFSTSQTEFIRRLASDEERLYALNEQRIHLVVDEVQDINPVQRDLIRTLVGVTGRLTAVGRPSPVNLRVSRGKGRAHR
jgi:Superfamily I DNA and RNA helicases